MHKYSLDPLDVSLQEFLLPFFEPEEEHWHGAAPGRFMVHLALQQVDQRGSAGDWGEKVSDDEYATAAAMAVKA